MIARSFEPRSFKPRAVAAAGMLLLLSSCHSAPTRLFGLAAVAPTAISTAYTGPPVHVEAIHVPPALDRMEIPSEVAPDEFKVSEVDHWIAPLGQITRQVLTSDLAARLPEGRVIFPHLARPVGAIGINVDLLTFSAGREGARLQVSWVGTGSSGQTYGGTMALHTAHAVVGSASMAGALSALLAELADGIVAQLLLLPPAEPSK